MKILFYTIDMVEGVERLMPWRTLVEAARNLSSIHETAICSSQNDGALFRQYQGVDIYRISSGFGELKKFVEDGAWQVVFYPVSYRIGLKGLSCFSEIPAKMIAYVPGGLYPLDGVMSLCANAGLRISLPYLIESMIPHGLLTQKLRKAGFKGIVCQSPATSADAIDSGWNENEVFTALPGMDDFGHLEPDYSLFDKLMLEGKKYFLFSGAPAKIRGSQMALKAFDRIADLLPDVMLVMLMRSDVSSDFSEFKETAASAIHKDRIIISYEKLNSAQLRAFFADAYAVLLPFLLIPSEIPLTYFEVLACGTPVITFANAGTTDYLSTAVKIARKRNVSGLADAMLELCNDVGLRNGLAFNAIEIMHKHTSWEKSSEIWENAIERSVL